MRVVVLGGGIAGVFTAYFLRRAGAEVVGVGGRLEYPLASLVLTTHMPHVEDAQLARESLEVYRSLARVRPVKSVDILPEWAPVEGVRGLPGLREDEVAVVSTDYLIPVRRVVARLRRELGFLEAWGLLRVEGRRAHVEVEGRRLEGDAVVLAAGHRNRALAEAAGLWLPLRPYECYAAVLLAPRRLWGLSVGDYVLGWYGRPLFPPLYIAGDGCGELGRGPPPGYGERIARLVAARFGWAVPLAVRAGACEVGPTGGPLLGRHPDVENLYVLGGLDGYGSMVGPALARRLAQLVVGGEADAGGHVLERGLPERFDPCAVSERHDWAPVLRGGAGPSL